MAYTPFEVLVANFKSAITVSKCYPKIMLVPNIIVNLTTINPCYVDVNLPLYQI